jgi:hypothetical protein
MEYGWIERLRSVDEWPSTDAIATSVHQIIRGNRRGDGAWRTISFQYRCGSKDFGGTLFVDSYCSVYELAVGEHFEVQYNPKRPRQYFCKEATSVFLKGSFIALCLLIMGILYGLSCEVFGR